MICSSGEIVGDKLTTPDGLGWDFIPKGSLKVPGDPYGGVWTEDRVVMWTGHYRKLESGEWRKCTTTMPLDKVSIADHIARGFGYPGEALSEARFDARMIERRPANMAGLAAAGVREARRIGGQP